jgi:hypothetical protein
MVEPAEVDSGLACGCTCVSCGSRLVAKKGPEVAWHFAHHATSSSMTCIESAIHAAAKQILLEANWLRVPEKIVTVEGRTSYGKAHWKSTLLASARNIRFDCSKQEVWNPDASIRPDVIGYRGDRRLLVEMYFTHKVDVPKRKKLAALGLPAIEVDLSDFSLGVTLDDIRERVLEEVVFKEWLYHPGEKEAKAALRPELEAEIAELNRVYEARLAEQKKVEERHRREEEARLKLALERRQNIAQAHERYRQLPRDEKERQLRETLGIKGSWPYYLNRPSPEAAAIDEQPLIWQAAFFARFVFGRKEKEKGSRPPRIELDILQEWVTGRFGVVQDRSGDVLIALKKYLAYLRACGFLQMSEYNPYAATYYEVVHDGLEPRPRPPADKAPAKSVPGVFAPVTRQGASGSSPAGKVPHWLWRASWPERAVLYAELESLEAAGTHPSHLLRAIGGLVPSFRPPEPSAFAAKFEAEGIPSDSTLALLVQLGLALRVLRPN